MRPAAGAVFLRIFFGEIDGGVDGSVVGGSALEEELVGAQPKEGAEGVFEGVEGLAEARGDDGFETGAPADDAGEEVEGKGARSPRGECGELLVRAFGEEGGLAGVDPAAEEVEGEVAGSSHVVMRVN